MNWTLIALIAAVIFLVSALQNWKERGKTIGVLNIIEDEDGDINYAFGVNRSIGIPKKGYVKFKVNHYVNRVNNNSYNEDDYKED